LIGNTYAAQNEFDAAVNEYKTVIEKNPKAIPAYMMLGIIKDLQKQPSKANEYYQKVLALNKNFPLAANNLA
jgi:Flp pilus assembly protein TadD